MDETALRVILRKSSYAILGHCLSYHGPAEAKYAFTYYIPRHDSHWRWGTKVQEYVSGAAHVTASAINIPGDSPEGLGGRHRIRREIYRRRWSLTICKVVLEVYTAALRY